MTRPTLEEVVREGFISELSRLGRTVMIYGSYAYGTYNADSDLDVLAVDNDVCACSLAQVIRLVHAGQRRLSIPIADEVPAEVKLLASWDDLATAASGAHFYDCTEHTSPVIHPIEKTATFLASDAMRMRLFQNVLIGRVIAFNDRFRRLPDLQLQARIAMVRIYAQLGGHLPGTTAELVEWLIGKGDSDLWLGFRDNCAVRSHLHAAFGEALELARHCE